MDKYQAELDRLKKLGVSSLEHVELYQERRRNANGLYGHIDTTCAFQIGTWESPDVMELRIVKAITAVRDLLDADIKLLGVL